jgi:hypothetical protein
MKKTFFRIARISLITVIAISLLATAIAALYAGYSVSISPCAFLYAFISLETLYYGLGRGDVTLPLSQFLRRHVDYSGSVSLPFILRIWVSTCTPVFG